MIAHGCSPLPGEAESPADPAGRRVGQDAPAFLPSLESDHVVDLGSGDVGFLTSPFLEEWGVKWCEGR